MFWASRVNDGLRDEPVTKLAGSLRELMEKVLKAKAADILVEGLIGKVQKFCRKSWVFNKFCCFLLTNF